MNNLCIPEFEKGTERFSAETLNWITSQNLWNIWVPKLYDGRECSFTEGLQLLQQLARHDGSLGWTVTLCSGANYFVGNLQPETAQLIFTENTQKPIFGGSGGLFGYAEKAGDSYRLSGTWKYATGGPYLTHVTLNAKITQGGKELLQEDGSPVFKSFVIPKDAVNLIDDWNTMGMQATRTCSFSIDQYIAQEDQSFQYDHFYLPQAIYKINFRVFADLTLWINYIGIAQHFEEELNSLKAELDFKALSAQVAKAEKDCFAFAAQVEDRIANEQPLDPEFIAEIHQTAAASVRELSRSFIAVYPHLGINAARENNTLNRIFRDYFTATQHRNFTR
ncbi:acyl-CoA dehydrogenase [Leeuwenhoekiella sp. H156]|uniref:acyl-CoA dehydrogenase n=1 Tax=Leeuwenhoekiella sp. H156 TaxID=3450128 RepID=UPI003FA40B40